MDLRWLASAAGAIRDAATAMAARVRMGRDILHAVGRGRSPGELGPRRASAESERLRFLPLDGEVPNVGSLLPLTLGAGTERAADSIAACRLQCEVGYVIGRG